MASERTSFNFINAHAVEKCPVIIWSVLSSEENVARGNGQDSRGFPCMSFISVQVGDGEGRGKSSSRVSGVDDDDDDKIKIHKHCRRARQEQPSCQA